METVCSKFVVYYDEPFWVGLVERRQCGCLEAARHVFGPEPGEAEVAEFVLTRWGSLRFSPALAEDAGAEPRELNPKRMRRMLKRESAQAACGTKAQQALQLQREESKQDAAVRARQRREEEQEFKFRLRQAKRKEKHKGH